MMMLQPAIMDESFSYPVPQIGRSRLKQAEGRAAKAEARTERSKTRIEAAETRTEQAKTRTEAAETRTEQAETRTEAAETRTEQAELRAEQAETALESIIGALAASVPSTGSPADAADLRALGRLTARQREVLQLTAKGENTKQIAGLLKISSKTVEYHRKKLMSGLDLHDVPALVRFALRVELITAEA